MPIIYSYPNQTALVEKCAQFIMGLANHFIDKNDRFTWALSGGKTPNALFEFIATHHAKTIDWKKVYIFWSDERMVPADNEENNSFQAKKAMLHILPIPADNLFFTPVDLPILEAAKIYEDRVIRLLGSLPAFDLIMLGLGTDGHTASLFPGTKGLTEKERLVIAVDDDGIDPPRISFTFPLINQAKNVMFLVSGNSKKDIVKKILEPGTHSGQHFPAQDVNPFSGQLYWFMDADAMPAGYAVAQS